MQRKLEYYLLYKKYLSAYPAPFGYIHPRHPFVLTIQYTARLLNGPVRGKLLHLLESGEKINGLEPEEARELAVHLRQKWLRDVRDDYTATDREKREFFVRSGAKLMDKVKIASRQSGSESDVS